MKQITINFFQVTDNHWEVYFNEQYICDLTTNEVGVCETKLLPLWEKLGAELEFTV